jgi:hypothetical protein
MQYSGFVSRVVAYGLFLSCLGPVRAYELDVMPPERKSMTDQATGVALTFLTTNPAADTNLYFHDRSWLSDGSLILFNSERQRGGAMAYVTATAELVRIATPKGAVGQMVAAVQGPRVFGIRGREVLELTIRVETAGTTVQRRSKATMEERVVCTLPPGAGVTGLDENCDGTRLAVGVRDAIVGIDVRTGTIEEVCHIDADKGYGGHIQWSHTDPHLLSYAGYEHRLMVVDSRTRQARAVYEELPGELVTHEHWWVDDQLLFCGGMRPRPTEDPHVKVINVHTGIVRIIGPGSWWPEATPEEISKRTYWHCAGSDDGRWVVADNWHGGITLFEGRTTRPHVLTTAHRTYGHGVHPHPGWDRQGKQVVFTSHLLGDPNVCVATIPPDWQRANR